MLSEQHSDAIADELAVDDGYAKWDDDTKRDLNANPQFDGDSIADAHSQFDANQFSLAVGFAICVPFLVSEYVKHAQPYALTLAVSINFVLAKPEWESDRICLCFCEWHAQPKRNDDSVKLVESDCNGVPVDIEFSFAVRDRVWVAFPICHGIPDP